MCWFLYHKRTGFARRVRFYPFTPQIWLRFIHRTDSIIMTLMSYSINSGLLTWWDLQLCQSDTLINPSSIVTTGVLITVRGFPLIFVVWTSCYDKFSADTNTLIWEIFYWPMGKSTYSIISGEETNQLTFIRQSMRILSSPCKGPSLVWPAESASDLHHFQVEQPWQYPWAVNHWQSW